MDERKTAEILAFPKISPVRLKSALEGLEKALAEQKTAVLTWQATLRDLRQSMGHLRTTLVGYDVALKQLAVNVVGLNAETRRLESWADETIKAAETVPAITRDRAAP